MPIVQSLEFDSRLFGYPVGRITTNGDDDLSHADEIIKQYKLLYIVSEKEIDPSKLPANATWVDTKVTLFCADLPAEAETAENICIYKGEDYDQLLKLAYQSGVYSRFKTDKNFKNGEYEKLYKIWLDKSISGQLGVEVFVYKEEGKITGFITIESKNGRAEIGLLAVDENSRGKGIGEQMLCFSMDWASKNNVAKLFVATQEANVAALKFYQKAGFEIFTKEYIYHAWN